MPLSYRCFLFYFFLLSGQLAGFISDLVGRLHINSVLKLKTRNTHASFQLMTIALSISKFCSAYKHSLHFSPSREYLPIFHFKNCSSAEMTNGIIVNGRYCFLFLCSCLFVYFKIGKKEEGGGWGVGGGGGGGGEEEEEDEETEEDELLPFRSTCHLRWEFG